MTVAGGPNQFELAPLEPTVGLGLDDPARVLERARAEARRISEQARAEGYRAGYEEGFADGRADLQVAVAALAEAVTQLRALREAREEQLLGEAAALALALAEKVVGGTLAVQPQRVVDVVRGALRQSEERRGLKLLVNPDDLAIVEGALAQLRAEVGGLELLEVQGERRVGRGGVVVRGEEGELELTVASQLKRARELVEAELAGGEDEG